MSLYKYNLFVMKNIVIMDSEFQVDVECGLITHIHFGNKCSTIANWILDVGKQLLDSD